MKRRDLEHLIRAAADIADDEEIVVDPQMLLGRLAGLPVDEETRERLRRRIVGDARLAGG